MKSLNKRELIILSVTVGLAMLYVAIQFVIKPMLTGREDIDQTMRHQRAKLIKAESMLALKSQVDERAGQLSELIGMAQTESAEMSTLLAKIESAAKDANIHITNTQPQRMASQKFITFYPVELQVSGQWVNMIKFFHLIQSQPNYCSIDELSMEKNADATADLNGRVVISRMRLTQPL